MSIELLERHSRDRSNDCECSCYDCIINQHCEDESTGCYILLFDAPKETQLWKDHLLDSTGLLDPVDEDDVDIEDIYEEED